MAGSWITDDLVTMLEVDEFASDVTWVEGGQTIQGIFDDEDQEIEIGDGTSMIHSAARLTTQSYYGVSQGDTLTINMVAYEVSHKVDDGTGGVVLHLERGP